MKAYTEKEGNFQTFLFFQSGFLSLMGLIKKYWIVKFIAITDSVQKSMLLIININISLET